MRFGWYTSGHIICSRKVGKICGPTVLFWNCKKRVLHYLIGTNGLGLRYGYKNEINLFFYVDADWANDTATRKSISEIDKMMG